MNRVMIASYLAEDARKRKERMTKVANWKQFVENCEALAKYISKEDLAYLPVPLSTKADDTLYSAYQLYKMLRTAFDSDPTLHTKAKEIHTKRGSK